MTNYIRTLDSYMSVQFLGAQTGLECRKAGLEANKLELWVIISV